MTDDNLKDWPVPLRLNVAALELAPFLYYKKCEVYGGGALWETLSFEAQRAYVEVANAALQVFKPEKLRMPKADLHLVRK